VREFYGAVAAFGRDMKSRLRVVYASFVPRRRFCKSFWFAVGVGVHVRGAT